MSSEYIAERTRHLSAGLDRAGSAQAVADHYDSTGARPVSEVHDQSTNRSRGSRVANPEVDPTVVFATQPRSEAIVGPPPGS
jgi:hypothetical protein